MKTMATTAGPMRLAQRALLGAAKKVLLYVDADIDALSPIASAELASGFPAADLRRSTRPAHGQNCRLILSSPMAHSRGRCSEYGSVTSI